jgi:hypothetical protein
MKGSQKLRYYFQNEKAKLYPLSISSFPLKSPADDVYMKELAYGKFSNFDYQLRAIPQNIYLVEKIQQ